jgi:hypothetical protein
LARSIHDPHVAAKVTTMSIFAFYFAAQLLQEAGWPRKLGMFKSEGYDTSIVESAYAQSIDWGAALGAGRPRLALQMIAEMLRDRNWEGDDAPDVKVVVEGSQETWSKTASPQEAAQPLELAKHWGKSTISVQEFTDRRLLPMMDQVLLEALLWGLSNPDRFDAWYTSNVADHESKLPLMRSAGVDVGELPSLPQFYEDSEQIVRDYERDIGPLRSIPPKLLADAEALGWRV